MGAKGSKAKNEGIDEDEWEKTGEIYNSDIVTSNKGRGQAQLNRIAIEPRHDLTREKDIYTYRQNTNNSLVKCIGAQADKAKKTTLCGNQQQFKVLTERIPKRWHEMPQISFPESLYALSESLAGYEQLHDKAGTFQISPTMMGVNEKGEMKVWLNENFASNHPSDERPNLQITSSHNYPGNNSQSSMVRNVISIIEQKCQNGSFPRDFKQVLINNSTNFENAQKSIEEYAVSHRIFIPSKLTKSYLQGNGYVNQASQKLLTEQSKVNEIDYNSPTNRFTYEDQSQPNNYQNSFYTSQNYQQREGTLNNANSRAYNFNNQNSDSRKRYTYQEMPGNNMIYQESARVNTNNGSRSNQHQGPYHFTTYEHNRKEQPMPSFNYQQIERSQVTRQF